MKLVWNLLFAFLFPASLAASFAYKAFQLLDGKLDCRNSCVIFNGCADESILAYYDYLNCLAVILGMLSFFLPVLMALRNENTGQTKFSIYKSFE